MSPFAAQDSLQAAVETRNAIEIYKQATTAVNDLWTAYAVVALVLLWLVYKDNNDPPPRIARQAISAGFIGFVIGNLAALYKQQGTVLYATNALSTTVGCEQLGNRALSYAECGLHPFPVFSVVAFHIATDALVLGAIWSARRRKRAGPLANVTAAPE